MIEFYPFQIDAQCQMDHANGRCLVSMEQGLGKTLTSLGWAKQKKARLPALVVCPAGVKYNWEIEAHRADLGTDMCESREPPKQVRSFRNSAAPVTIINYDILKDWLPYLRSQRFGTLIIDECQNLANLRTKRTKAAKSISLSIPHLLALSGTPLLNKPAELWPVLNMLWPNDYKSFFAYAQKYCAPRYFPRGGWNFSGSANLDELNQELRAKGIIRIRRKDVIDQLPDNYRRRVIVPIDIQKPEEYWKAKNDFLSWLRQSHGLTAAKKAKKSEKLVKIGYLLRLTAKLKIKGVVDWVNNFLDQSANEKIILFMVHKAAIDVFEKRLKYEWVTIDGSVSAKKKQIAVDQFQNQSRIRVCLGNILSAGVGQNLTAASEIGIVEFPWRPGDLAQAEKRADRIGQTDTVWTNYFVAKNTIEEDLCRVLQKKQEVISSVLDGGSFEHDFNLHDEVLKALEGGLF